MRGALLVLLGATTGCAATAADAGARPLAWQVQASGCHASLRGLSVVDEAIAWASGSDGTFLRTVDGGRSWHCGRVPGAEGLDFRDVQAFGAERALLLSAGTPARMFLTEDGGASFVEVYANDAGGVFFDSVAFGDDAHGLAFSDPVDGAFLVVRTTDGGRTWSKVPAASLPAPQDGEAGFAASGTCLAMLDAAHAWIGTGGGAAARVLRTTDGGRSWTAVPTPLRSGAASTGIFSLAFRDAQHGVAVGGDYQQPELRGGHAARSDDGGRSWQPIEPGPRGFRSCVAHVAARTWVAVGTSGADVSFDDGRHWQPLGDVGYHAVAFAAGGSGWAVGAGGRIAHLAPR